MSEDGATCPVCQGAADAYGDHQVGCDGNGDRIHRHDSIRDAVYSAAQSAALAPRKEAPSVIPGSSSRPADVYLPNWKGVSLLPWTSMSSPPCSSKHWSELPPLQDTPCVWGRRGRWPPMLGPVGRQASPSFPSLSNP